MAVKIKTSKNKGPIEYPDDHKPGIRVPLNGSCCLTCEYYKGSDLCSNEYFKKWNGSEKLPYPAEEYCSDWYEQK
jgi:hypothetical protein